MSYSTYDSYTTADGTQYVARYKSDRNIIEKYDVDGKRSVISSQKLGSSKSGNKNAVATTFDSFKEGLTKAEEGQNLTYTDDGINAVKGSGGFLGLGGDTASTLTMSDGTVISSSAGNTSNEVITIKRLADEITNTKAAPSTTTTTTTTSTDDVLNVDNLTDTSLTDGPGAGGGTSLQDTPFVDTSVNRPDFVETTPSTEVLQLKPGEVAPITPSTPKTVVQQVAPVTQTQTPQATPYVMPGSVSQTGTTATPVQTAGLSAVPGQVSYKTCLLYTSPSPRDS